MLQYRPKRRPLRAKFRYAGEVSLCGWHSVPDNPVGSYSTVLGLGLLLQDSITELFDPHGYYSNLSILQSAPAAVRIMDGYKRLAHKQLRHHFSDTSPLVKAAYNDSKSSNTRKILHQQQQQPERLQSKAACKPELEPQQKYTLSELAQSISKKGKDLRQVGSNASYNRAGWMEEAAPSTVYY